MSKGASRAGLLTIALAVALGSLIGINPAAATSRPVASGQVTAASATNPVPDVVPAPRQWSGGEGMLTLGEQSRIVVDPANRAALADEAATLADDLARVSGLRLPVVSGAKPESGDVFLSLRGADAKLGDEGYELTVADSVLVTANDDTGLFYGTQTVLQLLRTTTTGHRALPRGVATDWPTQRERGYLLDAGRKYYAPDFIVSTIREMSYLRLNTLQLHLSDHNAFRLVSERHPELAAPDAYTRADIRRFEAAARRYHVDIVPEIEMPSHASAILHAHPDLGFDCQSMGGGTFDVTNPAARSFTRSLIDEFAPLFAGPEFHIATDEYATQDAQSRCPELVDYARAHGFGSPSDVFVDFINEMNGVVRSHGKQMVIWNWWDVDQKPTISPDKNIKVEAWTTSAESSGDHTPQQYLAQGYEVVVSPSDQLYVTPGFPLLPDPKKLYEEWEPLVHPRLAGYQISVWSDNAITRPINYFDGLLRRPREVLADRTWGGPRRGTVSDFFARADAIGTPPGVPEYSLPGTLTGTPYGTSPAYDNSSSTFDKAFDGDPITYFLYAEPNGGYTGIDLGAARTSQVSLVRFFAEAQDRSLDRMVGGRFEGCAEGPTSGCRTLATVDTKPEFGWNEVPVSDAGKYRWLRYVGPDNGYSSVAEVQFVAPTGGVTVQTSRLRQLGENLAKVRYRNTSGRVLHDVRLDLSAYATQDRTEQAVRPTGDNNVEKLEPGEAVTSTWKVDLPLTATSGDYDLVGRAVSREEAQGGFTRTTLAPALDTSLEPTVVGLNAGDSTTTRLRVTNNAARSVDVGWHVNRLPTDNGDYTLSPETGTLTVPSGGTRSAALTASAASTASEATAPIRVDLSTAAKGQPDARAGAVALDVLAYATAKPSLAATFDSPGISDDSDPAAGNFDGGGFSYSAQELAKDGLTPGATVSHDGLQFTWPDAAPGTPSNTRSNRQVIQMTGSGAKLGFLGAGAFGAQSGTVYVTYTDGSISQSPLRFADWYWNDAGPGGEIVATGRWNVPPDNPFDPGHEVSVYYTSLPLDPGKTVKYVTLPDSQDLHVFAMTIGG